MDCVGFVVFFGVGIFAVSLFVGRFFTFRQDFDFLTRSSQGVLRRANGLQTVAPFGHFQGFLVSGDGLRVLRTFGQQAKGRHAHLPLSAQAFLGFVQKLNVLQNNTIGEGRLQGFQFLYGCILRFIFG